MNPHQWGPPPQPGYGYQPWPQPQVPYRRPEPSVLGSIVAILGGAFVGLISFAVWLATWEGLGWSAFVGLFMAGAASLVLLGVAHAARKKLHALVYVGVTFGIVLVAALAGPPASRARIHSRERELFAKLGKPDVADTEFNTYEHEIPEQFRRPEWRYNLMELKIRQAGTNAAELRKVQALIEAEPNKTLLAPARLDVTKKLADLYDQGKARMYASSGAADPEFPTDVGLRAAFAQVLADLANAPSPNIYVTFDTSASLAAPAGTTAELKDQRHLPKVLAAFPKANAPVVDAGQAFSTTYDARRRQTFLTAMTESFGRVFNGALITLVPLEKGESTSGKIVIDVISKTRREPDFYTYTDIAEGGGTKVIGLLFAISVEWDFKLVGRDGKVLYTAPQTSSRAAEHVHIDSEPGDPEWAPYSIMMDSAYYNYARELNGRFGFEPSPVKDTFSYAGTASTAPATP